MSKPEKGQRWYVLRKGATHCSKVDVTHVTEKVVEFHDAGNVWARTETMRLEDIEFVERVAGI